MGCSSSVPLSAKGVEPETVPSSPLKKESAKGAVASPVVLAGLVASAPYEDRPAQIPDKTSSNPGESPVEQLQEESDVASEGASYKKGRKGVSVQDVDGRYTSFRGRRHGRGMTAVHNQLRNLAAKGAVAEDHTMLVGDSDDEDTDDLEELLQGDGLVDSEVRGFLMSCLGKHFVFRGLNTELLGRVVNNMQEMKVEVGTTIVEQGQFPSKDDCMFVLQEGTVDVIIAGSGQTRRNDSEVSHDGRTIRMHKEPGWVFGDVALLLNSPRSASVVAKTNCALWTLSRGVFISLVMKHAEGARALRFVRKLPLLKGLSENALFDAVERLTHEYYSDGERLIKYGEAGDRLFLIRYGEVKVVIPKHVTGEEIELAKLGRGHFAGERTLITNKLRTADCIACGPVTALVMGKQDFLQLDSPLLGWMKDYDAMASVLKSIPILSNITGEQLDFVIDNFQREEYARNEIIATAEEQVSRVTVVRQGTVACLDEDGREMEFLRTTSSHCYFGELCLEGKMNYPGTLVAKSDNVVLLGIPRKGIFDILSTDNSLRRTKSMMSLSAASKEFIIKTMRFYKTFNVLTEEEIVALASEFDVVHLDDGEILLNQGETVDTIFILERGKLRSLEGGGIESNGKPIMPGHILAVRESLAQDPVDRMIASDGPSRLLVLSMDRAKEALGMNLSDLIRNRRKEKRDSSSAQAAVRIQDLHIHRIVGKGQFGSVRMVSHKTTQTVYALKAMSKAPMTKKKTMEHVMGERTVMSETNDCPFCIRLIHAYQDARNVYLLMEWAPGGEMFNLLNALGQFSNDLARFYAASVILAYEFIHGRGIIYRDLKPENLLLDENGYLKIADFGLAKKVGDGRTYTICGTPDYQAPEAIMHKGQGRAADWWALGVLIFEMLVGEPPFQSVTGDPWDTFRAILSGRLNIPDSVPSLAADLIYSLLQNRPEDRLGCGRNSRGAQEVMAHPWFDGLDWEALRNREMEPPYKPTISSKMDTANFEEFDDDQSSMPFARNTDKSSVLKCRFSQDTSTDQFSWDMWEWIDDYHADL